MGRERRLRNRTSSTSPGMAALTAAHGKGRQTSSVSEWQRY
jgi:hypothetical protein